MPEIIVNITCPFCESRCIEPQYGNTRCLECEAEFEIDDGADCVFGDRVNLRLPAVGTIWAECGLIQAGEHQNCL